MASLLNAYKAFSFREKSILISLLAVAVLYGGYFMDMLRGVGEHTMAVMLGNMVGIVIALVIVHVVFHIVIALDVDNVEEAEDERDRAVARRASVYGFNVLFVAVLLVTGRIIILGSWAEAEAPGAAPDSFEIANLLLAGLVLSDLVYYAAQLFFYRRGLQS